VPVGELLPSVLKPFAPEGKTPVVKGSKPRDHVSAISTITPEEQLSTGMREETFPPQEALSRRQDEKIDLQAQQSFLLVVQDVAERINRLSTEPSSRPP
jgi:hypothetical protein